MKLGRPIVAALLALAPVYAASAGDQTAPVPRADITIQALIERTAAAIVRGDQDLSERFDALRDPSIGSRQDLLLQIALYLERADGTERSMSGALILHHLAFTPGEKLQAILPHLDGARPGLRHVFTELLGTIDRPEGGEPDFSFYEAWMLKESGSPPWALIRYLYEVSPVAAVSSMERVYGAGPGAHREAEGSHGELRKLLAVRDTGAVLSAQDQTRLRSMLDTLSRDPGWWRRLYAAAIISRYPDLATPDTKKRLLGDANPLVSGTLQP